MPHRNSIVRQDFPVTRWTLVARAGDVDPAVKRAALAEVIRHYLPALRSHLVIRRRIDPHRADDLLQQFMSDRVIGADVVARAARERGRFRTFLLTTLDHFVSGPAEYERAKKRRPSGQVVPADAPDALAHADDAIGPGDAFDIAWARQVLDQAVAAMRAECERTGRADVWAVFDGRVLRPTLDGGEPTPYEDLATRLGAADATAAANLLVTGKRMYARHLKAVVAEYEPDEGVDQEIADLKRALAVAGGRR